MPLFIFRRLPLFGVAGFICLLCSAPVSMAAETGNRFCGMAASAGALSDLSLEYGLQQPASMVTCGQGYFLEKCGDHENANKVFDKCVAAGYAGAMIWKALLLDEGAGVEQDLPRAAELFHRAAVSGDTSYGPIGKMHYATVLYLGRGVEKDQAEAMKWFQAAADEGSEEAREFLNTGYHTGYRDQNGLGAGTPTAAARAPLLTPAPGGTAMASADAIKSEPQADALPVRPAKVVTNVARKLINASRPEQVLPAPAPAPAPVPASPDVEVRGQQLQEQHALAAQSGGPKMPLIMGLLLAACFAFGIFRQQQGARSVAGRPAGN